jgi:molecular chaperone GrpE
MSETDRPTDPSGSNAEREEGQQRGAEGGPPQATQDPIAVLTAERDRLKDAALRAMADLDNYRKRSRRDTEEMVRKAREDLLRELLPVFDNLERAKQYVGASPDPKAIAQGVEMVLRLFEDTLGRLGGKRLRSLGEFFDPTLHEAIQQIQTPDHPTGTIVKEELPGYTFNDRLLRPAMVVVSKGPPPAETPKD